MDLIKKYYKLTKPGIVYGNLISAIGGFFLASKLHVNLIILISLIVGVSLVIASSCVMNNFIDRGIDQKMGRTKRRSIATGEISGKNAIIYAVIIGLIGYIVLILFTNYLTVLVGLAGMIGYVVVYGIAKRTTIHETIIGSFSGAMPIVAGYTAVTNRIDIATVILFLIMVFWQMPHFYAISLFQLKDYTNAGLVLWPIKKGIHSTKIQMIIYTIAYVIATLLLFVFHYRGYIYFTVMALLGIAWIWQVIKGFKTDDKDISWAKKNFKFSLVSLLALSILISIPFI